MVRFTDGPTTEATLEIPASPRDLWPIVTDIDLPAAQSDELQRTEWLEGHGEPALGARFRGHNQRGDTQWQTESTVTEFEVERRFTWTVGDVGDAIASWGFELQELSPGRTLVRQWTRLGPGRSGVTWAIRQNPDAEEQIIEGRLSQLRASMAQNLDAIAAMVAGDSGVDASS